MVKAFTVLQMKQRILKNCITFFYIDVNKKNLEQQISILWLLCH